MFGRRCFSVPLFIMSIVGLVALRYHSVYNPILDNTQEPARDIQKIALLQDLQKRLIADKKFIHLAQRFQDSCDPSHLLPVPDLSVKDMFAAIGELIAASEDDLGSRVNRSCPRKVVSSTLPPRRVGLFSFPGSGNTWTRYLLQQLTGIETGAVYHSQHLSADGFPGEGKTDGVIVVKSHGGRLYKYPNAYWDAIIAIVQNPYDCLPNHFLYTQSHHGPVKNISKIEILPDSPEWLEFFHTEAQKNWPRSSRTIFSFDVPYLILFYEDMKSCLLRELVRVANFLELSPHLEKFSFCCALVSQRYQRPIEDHSHLYSEWMRQALNFELEKLADEMEPRFPLLSYQLRSYRLNATNSGSDEFKGKFRVYQ